MPVKSPPSSLFLALLAGFLVYRGALKEISRSFWIVLWIGLSAGWTNLAYVLSVIDGKMARVLLLFYFAPLWTMMLAICC